jgi:hypothetical protein
MPLAAMHHYGKGQVLFLGFEESWRWRFNTQDKVFARFWGQLLLHMALPHKLAGGASQVELSVNRAGLVVGKPAILHARLLDSNFMPYRAAQVEGVLEFLDAKPGQERSFKLVFDPVAGREKEGEYQAILPNQQPGRWQVQLSDPSWTMFPFSVALPPMHEQEEAALAAEALRTAASVSGGRYYQEESLHDMAKAIQPRQAKYELHQEVLLWGPMAFLIFAVVVTCEWVLRKFANMS